MNSFDRDCSTTRKLVRENGQDAGSPVAKRRAEIGAAVTRGGLYLQGWRKTEDRDFPLVSVLTVEKNAEFEIEETIRSVLGQDYPNVEYIVVDESSTDRTLEIIRKYETAIDFWISEPLPGFYTGVNKALQLAGGTLINVMNVDDQYLDRQAISRFVRRFQETNSDLVYSDTLLLDKKTGYGYIRHSNITKFHLANSGIAQQSFFYKRDLFERAGNFDESLKIGADNEFLIRALFQFGASRSYLLGPQIIFSVGGASSNASAVKRERDITLKKHYSPWEIRLFQNRLFSRLFRKTEVGFRMGPVERVLRKLFGWKY